jgi:DNA-binding MarR family transcriptional regulator
MDLNTNDQYPQLKLSNQLCFPFYAASMLITRKYQPLLEQLNLTYPQYLVLLVLWENDSLNVGQITSALLLNTNTVTPLLKRMEASGLVQRHRSTTDERQVVVSLTPKGKDLREQAAQVPLKLIEGIDYPLEDAIQLQQHIHQFIAALNADQNSDAKK